MQKLVVAACAGVLLAGAFFAGVAVGKGPPPQPRFVAVEELKWEDAGGLKLALLAGDLKKGPYSALVRLPAGYTSPLRMHTGAYEAVEVAGTSTHWMKGEDGTKAKRMTPGSYWSIPAKSEHVSACAVGTDCVFYLWQKTKYEVVPSKDDKALATKTAGTGSAGSAAGAAVGSAAKAATVTPGAGATTNAPTAGASTKAGSTPGTPPAPPPPAPKAPATGTGSGAPPTPKK